MAPFGAVTVSRAAAPRTLRVVSLNLWGGYVFEPLLAFVREQAATADLFCFQETLDAPALRPLACGFRTTLYRDLAEALPAFAGAFDPLVAWDEPPVDGAALHVGFGLATFVRRTLPVRSRRAVWIVDHDDTLDAADGLYRVTRWLQTTEVATPAGTLLVGNYHGIARPGTKLDTDDRLAQSRGLRRALAEHAGPAVLIGDFNLLPETASVRMLEAGLRNLVVERGIPTTRSRLNAYFGTPQEQPHADYAFVSPGLRVVDFQVPDRAISDHLPLLLTLDVGPPRVGPADC